MGWPMCCGRAAARCRLLGGRFGGLPALQDLFLLAGIGHFCPQYPPIREFWGGEASPSPTISDRLIAEEVRRTMDKSRQERVTARVRSAILLGELRPGDRLIEQTLAAEMQMSRGPVRDALRQLEQEGLVQI